MCGHCVDIYLQGYMSCPHYILIRFQLLSVRPVRESEGCTKTKRLKNYKMVIVGEVCVVSLLFGASCKIVISPLLFGWRIQITHGSLCLIFRSEGIRDYKSVHSLSFYEEDPPHYNNFGNKPDKAELV